MQTSTPSKFPVWPSDLNLIKIPPAEAQQIGKVAKFFRWRLAPDTTSQYPVELIKRGELFKSSDGGKYVLSRTLYITNHAAAVILNNHGGMDELKGGDCQTHVKFAWDLENGRMLVKKTSRSPFEHTLHNWIKYSRVKKPDGFPRIAGFYASRGKIKVLEEYYPVSLARHLRTKPEFRIEPALKLFKTLICLHHFTYTPPTLTWDAGFKTLSFSRFRGGSVFHGNLSPDHIKVDESGDVPIYRIISFGSAAQFTRVVWTPGWGSPETIRFSQGKLSISEAEFNSDYGQAKDIWTLGLLIGSILRGRFRTPLKKTRVPRFAFIADRLTVADGRIDDSGIASLKQEEIDNKIDSIIRKIKASESESGETLVKLWTLIKKCLRVDPEERINFND